ncbi:fatty acid desaturase DesE [Bacillus swezeyi]|uniref:Fatty acid desaturase n=1 Tax=Bacillus swezeyi TaxID=1925020 RepID=A0A1R1RMY2_9BACI|nr:fatty acid desaturase DesE [Bacillus swezeyi]MEC1261320.1 fatty acid desaturase DesE [Bacillus swezeyi]MED1739877.1 fatty acid desaturase DesE [Bacillus swezeyi]MED2929209.1 fatty acid desaturase DesE [Bacillus swezeyi]MED2941012.1 fatty acid desaturase DesE [Bacillus swezeyi]MED2963764.1 fatty acid desaturase DesE [Bacillus swezeyi]
MTEQIIAHKQKQLTKQVAAFAQADTKNSLIQLFNTFIPFFGLWFLAYLSLNVSYLLTLGLTVIAAGFLTRIFIIFHDCCHQSFFKQKRYNHILGFLTGVLTLFPYLQWQHSHSIHHATSSNLDKRGTGDIWLLTVTEYKAAPLRTKIAYRLYRNPFIMFILGPIYVFLITNRFNKKGARRKERVNTYLTNLAIVALAALCCLIFGWQSFLLVQGPIFLISGSIGVWLFYVQHTFEDSYFEADENWSYVQAAVEGSSFYKLPKLLQWLTGNIGYHHVHHLSPKVPNYKLETAHDQHEPLKNVPTITLKTSLQSLAFRLWDEEKKKFVTFRDIKTKSIHLPPDLTEKQQLRKNA